MYVSFSGRKGYHVEVFFDRIVDLSSLFNLYCHVIKGGALNPDKVEFRPTPTMAIKLPLSVHGKTGNVCWFVDQRTLAPIEDEAYILSIETVRADDVKPALSLPELEICGKKHHAVHRPEPRLSKDADMVDIGTILTEQGQRHNTMRSIAVYHRTNGYAREEVQRVLEEWYARQPQELIASSPEEVSRDITRILDWVYSDGFILPSADKRRTACVSESQMMIALNQSSRSARRIVFLLLMRTRMNEPRISGADIGKITGISAKTVYEVLHRLVSAGTVKMDKGRTLQLPDQSFASESGKYTVPHKEIRQYEMNLEISMRQLSACFDRAYHLALHTLIPQSKLRETLSEPEWLEYLSWAETFEDEDALPKGHRIDLIGSRHDLTLPMQLVRTFTAYWVDDRWLFPAYDMALILGYKNPSASGSLCPHKELWQIQVNRRKLPNGKVSHQVLNKNYIPLEDVLILVDGSSIPEKAEMAEYLRSLEKSKMLMAKDERGVDVS